MLYELLTGKQAFHGEDVTEILAAVVRAEPDWQALPQATPLQVAYTVAPLPSERQVAAASRRRRCAHRDSRSAVGAARGQRKTGSPGFHQEAAFGGGRGGHGAGNRRECDGVGLVAGDTVCRERPLVRLDVDLGPDVSLGSPRGADAILSPDGSRLVYVSQGRLFTRRLDQPNATELAGTEGAYAPFFSPDGQWVAFFAAGKLQKISVEGGAAITLCDVSTAAGGSWGEDGNIVAALSAPAALCRVFRPLEAHPRP